MNCGDFFINREKYLQKDYQFSGRDIKIIRNRLQLRQREFAAYLGVSESTICRWESFGEYPIVYWYKHFLRLKMILKQLPHDFFSYDKIIRDKEKHAYDSYLNIPRLRNRNKPYDYFVHLEK